MRRLLLRFSKNIIKIVPKESLVYSQHSLLSFSEATFYVVFQSKDSILKFCLLLMIRNESFVNKSKHSKPGVCKNN